MSAEAERCYSPQVGCALAFAAEVHANQRRKGKREPYLSHVLRVTALVAHYGGDEDQIIAAALHDAAEDRGGEKMLAQIQGRFGPVVADMVRECSDALVPMGQEKPDWRTRKEAYLRHVEQRGQAHASLVEACDKLANLEDLVEDLQESHVQTLNRFRGGPAGVRWYYRELGRVLIPQAPVLRGRYEELLQSLLDPDTSDD